VPEWLLDAPQAERRLVVAHEAEHLRARDNTLLAAACIVVLLLPWHPAAWWLARRLRLAIELDCDARVLRRGAEPGVYGALLLLMAGRSERLPFVAPALAETPSHLERRIIAMTDRAPRFARTRGALLVLCGATLLGAACETALPTSPEIEALDVAAAEQRAERLGVRLDDGAQYSIDGEAVDAAAARRLRVEQIASIELVRRGTPVEPGEPLDGAAAIRITTVEAAANAAAAAAAGETTRAAADFAARVTPRGNAAAAAELFDEARRVRVLNAVPVGAGFEGLLIVDGAAAPASSLRDLRPADIESVEVLKGPAAALIYTEPAARNGVLRITTKAAAIRP
jgi:hypothetical protein